MHSSEMINNRLKSQTMNTSSLNLNDVLSYAPLESLLAQPGAPVKMRNSSHIAKYQKLSLMEVLRFDGKQTKRSTEFYDESRSEKKPGGNNTIVEIDLEQAQTEPPNMDSP